jgi:hypothetical protein
MSQSYTQLTAGVSRTLLRSSELNALLVLIHSQDVSDGEDLDRVGSIAQP